jgi:hypothetical protein
VFLLTGSLGTIKVDISVDYDGMFIFSHFLFMIPDS